MKAVFFTEFGDSSVLKIGELPAPLPGPSEVQIRIDSTSVNPVDWKIRKGHLAGMLPHEFPIVPGWDAAGIVSEVGSDVRSFKVGDPVFAYCRRPTVQYGTYAEYTVVDQSAVARKPASLSFEESASVPLVALTAWQALIEFAKINRHDTVLVTAGSGGVGSIGVQLAKAEGARVIATASNRNQAYVTGLGADHFIDYTAVHVPSVIASLGLEVDVVFDCAGGNTLTEAMAMVKPGGRVVSIVDVPSASDATARNLRAGYVFVEPNGAQLAKIGSLIEAGKLQTPEVKVRCVTSAAAALDENEQRHVRGKVALKIDFA